MLINKLLFMIISTAFHSFLYTNSGVYGLS